MKSGKIAGVFTLVGMGLLLLARLVWRLLRLPTRIGSDPGNPEPAGPIDLPDPAVLQAEYDADAKRREEERAASAKKVDEMSDEDVLIEWRKHFGGKG